MELRELSELSEDYITDGLLYHTGNPQIFGISPFAPADFQASSATYVHTAGNIFTLVPNFG